MPEKAKHSEKVLDKQYNKRGRAQKEQVGRPGFDPVKVTGALLLPV
jgi:hypothetical protein